METNLAQEIIKDLQAWAKDNGRAPSRDEYHRGGRAKFTEHQIRDTFGNFTDALMAAQLWRSSRSQKSPALAGYAKSVEKFDFLKQLESRFESDILPHVGKYARPDSDKEWTGIFSSDHHSQWMDPFAAYVLIDTCKRIQPDVIGLDGDVWDAWEISDFAKNPRRQMTVQSEINYIQKHLFEPMRAACPKAQIDWFLGNHEARLFRYLCTHAPALASLDALQFDKLFKLEDYEINLVARKSFLNARRGDDQDNHKLYAGGNFIVTHGTSVAAHTAMSELKKWNRCGISGHIHRHQVYTNPDLAGDKWWVSLGAMCQIRSGEEYISDLVRWNQGFIIVHVWRGRVTFEYVQIHRDGFAQVGGVRYYRNDSKKFSRS